jgi:predicted small secreted protein
MKTLKTVVTVLFLALSLLMVNACRQTLDGAGKDIENAGEKIQDTAN